MGWVLGIGMDGRTTPFRLTAAPPFIPAGSPFRLTFTATNSGEPFPFLLNGDDSGGYQNSIVLFKTAYGGFGLGVFSDNAWRFHYFQWVFGQPVTLMFEPLLGRVTVSGAYSGNGESTDLPWQWPSTTFAVGGYSGPPFSNAFSGTISDVEYFVEDVVEDVVVQQSVRLTAHPRSGLFVSHELEEEEE